MLDLLPMPLGGSWKRRKNKQTKLHTLRSPPTPVRRPVQTEELWSIGGEHSNQTKAVEMETDFTSSQCHHLAIPKHKGGERQWSGTEIPALEIRLRQKVEATNLGEN